MESQNGPTICKSRIMKPKCGKLYLLDSKKTWELKEQTYSLKYSPTNHIEESTESAPLQCQSVSKHFNTTLFRLHIMKQITT